MKIEEKTVHYKRLIADEDKVLLSKEIDFTTGCPITMAKSIDVYDDADIDKYYEITLQS